MSHGTEGKVYDRVSWTWITPEEFEERQFWRRESAFMRSENQGQLATPMVIRDGMPAVRSQLDGRMYESKSSLRRTYKEGGVEEVGNDPSVTDVDRVEKARLERRKAQARAEEKKAHEALQRAFSLANLTTSSPGDDVKIKNFDPLPDAPRRLFGGMKP